MLKILQNPEQLNEVFSALEDGMLLLEQGYNEAKLIEEQIMKQMQIDQSYSSSNEASAEDLDQNDSETAVNELSK